MDLDLDQIVQKVYDLLSGDARTNGINWEKARFTSNGVRTYPGGAVSFAPGVDLAFETIPSGAGGRVPVQVRFWTSKHEGITAAEQAVQDYIGKISDVLFDTPQLAVASYSTLPWLENLQVSEIESNIEADPPYAEATMIATYHAYK